MVGARSNPELDVSVSRLIQRGKIEQNINWTSFRVSNYIFNHKLEKASAFFEGVLTCCEPACLFSWAHSWQQRKVVHFGASARRVPLLRIDCAAS